MAHARHHDDVLGNRRLTQFDFCIVGSGAGGAGGAGAGQKQDNVVDADYEIVDEDKKK